MADSETCAGLSGNHRCGRPCVRIRMGYPLCIVHHGLLAAQYSVRVVGTDRVIRMIVHTPAGFAVQQGIVTT